MRPGAGALGLLLPARRARWLRARGSVVGVVFDDVSLPTGAADRPGLEEDAVLRARERGLLVGAQAAALDLLASLASARVVPAIRLNRHTSGESFTPCPRETMHVPESAQWAARCSVRR